MSGEEKRCMNDTNGRAEVVVLPVERPRRVNMRQWCGTSDGTTGGGRV